jgi:acyl-CoA synthetase (NDP forming)
MTHSTASAAEQSGRQAGLEAFLNPASIAVIGAAPAQQQSIRGALMRVLQGCGYAGEVLPVNPSHAEIDGRKCYPDVASIGRPVDLAIIGIPARAVVDAAAQCAAAGVRAAIVISSGFAEEGVDGAQLQARLAEIARRTGMRVCGPNCEGFYNLINNIAATFSPAAEGRHATARQASQRRIAVIAQSGGLGFALYHRGRAEGLAFSHVLTTGNECDLAAADFIEHFAADPNTEIVLAYIEEIREERRFVAAAQRARAAGKRIVVIKTGRSEAARRAALAHTGSRTGDAAGFDRVCADCGIWQAKDASEAIAAAAALSCNPLARGRRVGIVTTAGGVGALLCDRIEEAGLTLPLLSPELQRELRTMLPLYGSAANPVDVTAQGIYTGGCLRAVELLLEGDEVDQLALVLSLSRDRQVLLDTQALGRLIERQTKPILVYSYVAPSDYARAAFAEAGTTVYAHGSDLVGALRALAPPERQAAHL